MKRMLAWMLGLMLCLSGAWTAGAEVNDAELLRGIGYGFVPEAMQGDWDAQVSYAEYHELVRGMLALRDEALMPVWAERAKAAAGRNDGMLRVDGCMMLFYAMQAMGCSDPTKIDKQVGDFWQTDYAAEANDTINAIDYDGSPFRDHDDQVEWDGGEQSVVNAAVFSCLLKRSHISYQAFYDHRVSVDQPLTRGAAVRSVVRLYETDRALALSYLTQLQLDLLHDTEDPAEAAALRAAILGRETGIEKAKELVKGRTYTGTAYYVSNDGKDKNDGKRPDRAWATLSKVNKAKLKKGDIVFFRRGGFFRGHLTAYTPGVTYSAYGEGPKPVLTSALDGSGADRWTLHDEGADGAKIWMFADEVPDCGIIVLDGRYDVLPYRVMPDWSGDGFVNHADQTPFVVEQELSRDLDFFSAASNHFPQETNFAVPDQPLSVGPLYLRCDAGNPGELYASIELGAAYDFQNYASDVAGIVEDCVLDNLCLVNSGGVGVTIGSRGWVVQNCELSGHGGTILAYQDGRPSLRGEALCGSASKDATVRGNWIHDNPTGMVLEDYQDMDKMVVDGLTIAGNLFERNDCDLNFAHVNYEADECGLLRDLNIEGNVFRYTGGGQHTLDMIRSGTDEIFGGTAWSRCISICQTGHTQGCEIIKNAFYHPLHAVFVSLLTPDQVPVIYGNRFYPAKASEAFAIWKLDGQYGAYSWIGWDEAEGFLQGYLGATNKISILE